MQQIRLEDLIRRFDHVLVSLNYKKGSIKNYRIFWKQVSNFFEQKQQPFFSEQLVYTFLKERYNLTGNEPNKSLTRNEQNVRQMAKKLIFFHNNNEKVGRMNGIPERKICNKGYLALFKNFNGYCNEYGYAKATCRNLKRNAINFLCFLEAKPIYTDRF